MDHKLSPNFLIELIKTCVLSQSMCEIVKPHLDYAFIENEEYKIIFKYIFDYHDTTSKVPTLGTISQNLPHSQQLVDVLAQIKEVNVHDKKDEILASFEQFIRKKRFVKLHRDVKELYDKGEHDKAMRELEKESSEINNFSLASKVHTRIFADYSIREQERKHREQYKKKTPIGIPPFDHHTFGGVENGSSFLAIARKGVGKSTLLRSIGWNLAFRGKTGVHFQAEGPKKDVTDGYDAMWTGIDINDIRKGELSGRDIEKIERARQAFLAQCGEIIVVAYEQFNQASMSECRQTIIDLLKQYEIEWAVFDYLEKFKPGDGKRYGTTGDSERLQKLAVAEKVVNIATEFNIFTATATQANDIEFKDWNNPAFVITRNNLSTARQAIDPFAYCVTLNQTMDENDRDIIRIHEEALRHHKIKSYESTYHIAQDRDLGRFIDVAKTNQLFWDPVNKKVIKNVLK